MGPRVQRAIQLAHGLRQDVLRGDQEAFDMVVREIDAAAGYKVFRKSYDGQTMLVTVWPSAVLESIRADENHPRRVRPTDTPPQLTFPGMH